MDDPFFTPLLERAEALGVPIYIHPAPPPEPVRQAYFSGLEPGLARMLSIAGWGWHAEVGLHTVRLIANGVFDRHPNLHIIIGHMGEMIPFFLARINTVVTSFAKLQKEFADYFHSNIHITTSGIFTPPPFNLCLEVVGIDRLPFSVDYPYSPNEAGRQFLEKITLAPVDCEKFAYRFVYVAAFNDHICEVEDEFVQVMMGGGHSGGRFILPAGEVDPWSGV